MSNAPDADPAVLDALWRVVAQRGWHGVTFRLIAEESGQSLDALRSRFPTPHSLLAAHARAVDAAVLSGTMPNQGGTARDRIFDLLMRRFDALAPHREGVLRFQRDLRQHPLLALSLTPMLLASMAWMLEGAEIDTSGLKGTARVQGLAGVWIAASRAWADDETVDLGPTMAALDKALDRAEQVARTLRLDDGDLAAPMAGATSGEEPFGAAAAEPPYPDTPGPFPGTDPHNMAGTEAPDAFGRVPDDAGTGVADAGERGLPGGEAAGTMPPARPTTGAPDGARPAATPPIIPLNVTRDDAAPGP